MIQQHLLSRLGLATALSVLVAQPISAYDTTQVTDIRLNQTPNGLQVILSTADGKLPQAFSASYGRFFIADIITTRLRLPGNNAYSQDNPIPGIESVTVTQAYPNTIRVKIISKAGVSNTQILPSNQGLIVSFSVPPDTTAAQPIPNAPTLPAIPRSRAGEANIPTLPAIPRSRAGEANVPTLPATPISPESEPSSETIPNQPTSPGSRASDNDAVDLVVTAEQETGYRTPNATSATRTDTPLRDIPQSIQVVPRQVIEDQQVTRVGEAARNVSGVTARQGYGGSTDNYTIRGFDASSNLRNGFKDEGFLSFYDVANIERIEVLKGPASVLYGQVEPGGVVNYITKQPLSEPFYASQFTVQSYDYYRPSLDISGPLTSNGNLLYRFNVAYESAGSFRDFVDSKLFFAAPVLTYKLSENTSLTFEYEYANLDRTFDRGFLAEAPFFNLPISRFLGEPGDSYQLISNKTNYILEHRFSDNWRLRNAGSAQIFDAARSNAQPRNLQPDGRTLRRRFTVSEENAKDYSLQTDLIGKLRTGSLEHQVLVGFELSRDSYDYILRRTEFTPIDIFDPVYGSAIPTDFPTIFEGDRDINTVGIYLQDQLTLLPNVKLLAGGRFDFVDFNNVDITNGERTPTSKNYEAFSPRIGIVYQPIEPISLYASYSSSFKPNISATTSDGSLLDPEKG
ncbi:MAG TPA: TonB-dependent siderophore receptor, partial [Candidatus Obscuribacterales bacterium]